MSTIGTTTTVKVDNLLSKKRSWDEMALDDKEQERVKILEKTVRIQKQRVKLIRETFEKIIEIRRFLNSIGEYYLEDGEILE
jgi:hypothetical protein